MIPEKSNFCLSFSQYQLIYFLVFLFNFFYFETNHVNEKNVIIVRRSLGLMMINLSQWIQTGTEILYATFSVISNHFMAIYDNIWNNSFSSGYKTTQFFFLKIDTEHNLFGIRWGIYINNGWSFSSNASMMFGHVPFFFF